MRARRLAFFVLLLLSLDFGNPFVGGAFTFESSADGIQRRRESVAQRAASVQAPQPIRIEIPTRPAWAPEHRGWIRHALVPPLVCSGHVHARSDLPAASEEH